MNSETRVGIFVIISLLILAYFMINTGEWDLIGNKPKTYTVVCRFNNVVGLTKGAGVALSGVRIGEVDDIRLEGNKALVVMLIDDSVDFPASSEGRISSVGLLGQAAVEIIPDEISMSGKLAREVGEIGSRDPVTIDQLVAVLQAIGDDATELVGSVRDFLYGNEARIVAILENLRMFTDEMEQLIEENRIALQGSLESIKGLTEAMQKDLPGLLEDVRTLSTSLRKVVEKHEGNLDSSVERAKLLLEKLDDAAGTLKEILDKVNEGEGSVGKLLNEPETIESANKIMQKAENVITDFETFIKSPTKITFDYGFRTEYYDKSEDFKYFYRLTTHFNKSDSLFVELINDQIHNKPPVWDPNQTEEDNSQGLELLGDDFTISAMYGRKVPGGRIRVGLIESITGIAFDIGRKTDPVSVSLEGYDFGRDKGPHLKISAYVKVWDGLFLSMGYDDPVDEDKAQFFYGGGFRF